MGKTILLGLPFVGLLAWLWHVHGERNAARAETERLAQRLSIVEGAHKITSEHDYRCAMAVRALWGWMNSKPMPGQPESTAEDTLWLMRRDGSQLAEQCLGTK
jgi:hypothetical protein